MLQFLLSERNGRNRKRSRERNEGWSGGVERERWIDGINKEGEVEGWSGEREMGRDIEKNNENS